MRGLLPEEVDALLSSNGCRCSPGFQPPFKTAAETDCTLRLIQRGLAIYVDCIDGESYHSARTSAGDLMLRILSCLQPAQG